MLEQNTLTLSDHSFSTNELECMNGIQQVLQKYQKLDRFGVAKLQHFFDIEDDQMLLETHSKKERTLTIAPASQQRLKEEYIIITNWRFDVEDAVMKCCVSCSGACRFKVDDKIS